MMVTFHGRWRRLQCLCVLLAFSTTFSSAMPNILIGTEGVTGRTPGNLGEIDPGCWDSSSLAVIQTRRLRVGDSVGAMWDLMTYLRASQQQWHNDLFLQLAKQFWATYVDCVLSQTHGLGKRYKTTVSELRVMEPFPKYAPNYA